MGRVTLLVMAALMVTACSSSMMELAKRGDLAGVEANIAAGEDVNARSPRGTALVQAARGGHADVVRSLIAAGANLEAMAWTTGARHGSTASTPKYKRHVPVNVDSSGPQSNFMAAKSDPWYGCARKGRQP